MTRARDLASIFQATQVVQLDDLASQFNGVRSRFLPTSRGTQVAIPDPLRLLLTIDGVIQKLEYPEYVWLAGTPRKGFYIDSAGWIQFSESVPADAEFDARIIPSGLTDSVDRTRAYPFKPLDILLGG